MGRKARLIAAARSLAALPRCALALLLLLPVHAVRAQTSLVVASLDASAPLWKELDAAFVADYKKTTGRDVRIEQKTAPSSAAQVEALRKGLPADVVALDDAADIDALAESGFVAADWRDRFPREAAPWATTVVFFVREGSRLRIRDWTDLAEAGAKVVMPDPHTDALGRDAWLGGWAIVQRQKDGRGTRAVERFARRWLANAAPLAADRQAAIDRFAAQGAGDVLVGYESDRPKIERAALAGGQRKPALVVPPASLRIGRPVALVLPVTGKKGSGELAKAYLNFMYGEAAARIVAAHGLRPASSGAGSDEAAATRFSFEPLRWFSVDDLFGSRAQAELAHFGAGGWLDKLRAQPSQSRPAAAASATGK